MVRIIIKFEFCTAREIDESRMKLTAVEIKKKWNPINKKVKYIGFLNKDVATVMIVKNNSASYWIRGM